uniref:Uncharacterized protein LOC113792205 n=1 Tax=Dermatophagoides pteronyssinus TaxID=6956 RepID=A0A6P6XX31_DERPT|nr:uncharacterized protein LOC113792205 [Dermatophagoides pteronyssinus]
MSGRKFFKSNRSQRLEASSSSTIRRDVIDDFLLSNDEIEPIELNNKRKSEIIIQQEQEQPHQQQQNDNDDGDADSSGIDDDFEFDHFGEDDFEPLFIRCSTPNHQEFDYHHNLSQSINNNIERPKINPWDKALSENESLKEWVKKFNEHIEMVDNSEVVIKKIKH